MRKLMFSAILILGVASFAYVFGQPPDPNSIPKGTGDKDLSSNNIKTRSIALERVKREADRAALLRREDGIELNFGMIKRDFEGIQKKQTSIVNAYTKGKKINYKRIFKSAGKITEMGIRLNSNLFPDVGKKGEPSKQTEKPKANRKPKSVRALIIELDDAVGSFVTSEMFKDLRVVDPAISKITRKNLQKIIELSNALWLEAKRKNSEG